MNIPQGYKQTELGIIPDDWEIVNLGSIAKVNGRIGFRGYTTADLVGVGQGAYTIGGKHITNMVLDLHDAEYISWQKYYESPEIMVRKGDIVFAQRGTLGKSAFIVNDIGPATINPSLVLINKIKCDNEYLSYWLQCDKIVEYICSINSQTSIPMITQNQIEHIPVVLPTIKGEQRAIAEALSDIDGLIAALDKKITKKRLIKQGAMQQLLTGKKRLLGFTGDWIEIRLGDYTAMNSGGTPSSSIPEYYNGDIPFLSISDITISGKYIKKTEKTITKKGLKNSSARMFPRGTIMYAMYASLGKTSIADIELSCSQAILGITPNDKIDSNYLYYCLSFIENNVKEIGQTGTQTNLSKQIVQDFLLYIPNQGNEQQAIATILTDMDKEIADLETKCDKYRLLKSGMMQKLLTGQIRLTKPLTKVVPLVPELSAAREIPVDAHILAGHIVNRLWQSKGWGRTKLQKSLHLIGYCVQLNLGNEYIRNTAGPDDQLLMNYIDQKFKQYRHVNIKKERRSDGTVHYSYIPTPLIQELEMAYEQYPQNIREHIDVLLDKLSTTNLAGAEILSTLYAVWNNRIIKGEQITDDLLLADFYAWSQHKADFEERRVRNALDYMRKENIVPIGWGKYIDKKMHK